MKAHIILITLILFLLCSCVSIPKPLSVVESDNVEVVVQRGSSVGSIQNGDLYLSLIGNNIDDGEGSFVLGILNFSESSYFFEDTDISIWGGSSPSGGNWKLIEEWNAEEYYKNAEKEYRSAVFWTAFAGVLNTVNASMGSYSSSYVQTSSGRTAYVTTKTYNPGAVATASYMAQNDINTVEKGGKSYLNFLQQNLLYDSMIKQEDPYIGWVYFSTHRNSYAYYKIIFTNSITKETSSFILEVD